MNKIMQSSSELQLQLLQFQKTLNYEGQVWICEAL